MMRHEARILSCLYVLSLSLLVLYAIHGLNTAQVVSGPWEQEQLIILDAGHGGPDGGSVSVSGTAESGLNLALVRRLDAILGLMGRETLLTREGEGDLSDPEAVTISQKKVSDIRNRTALVNSHPGALLISIHQNTYPEDPSCRGPQVFYGPAGNSQPLGALLQEALNRAVSPDGRSAKPISRDVYLMNHVETASALIECGFLTNREEAGLLETPAYQTRLAAVIAVALMNYAPEADSGV